MISQSLNFCMITTFYPPHSFGGDATYVYRLTNELAKRGHHVEVIHCADAYRVLAGREPSRPVPHHPNVTIHTLRSGVGLLSPFATQQTGYPFFKAKTIRNILASRRFDVIHFHNISLVGGPGILKYGRGIKLYTTHEHWLVCPMHVLWKYNRELCTSKDCFRCTLSFRRPPQWWRYTNLLEHSIKHVDLFLSPSRFTLEKHREMGLDIPIVHLPYFLPSPNGSAPARGEGENENGRPYFLFVGRLEKIKGLQTLFPVFRKYGHADLLVAGDGDYETTLRAEGARIPGVKFLGRMSYTVLRRLYRDAIAVIVPSICYEVFGIIIIEAFAERTPVIVRDLGGLAEVVHESGGGIAYRTDAELVEAMEMLQTNPRVRRNLGEQGHAAYLEKWSEEPHLRQYLSLIARIAEERSTYAATGSIGTTRGGTNCRRVIEEKPSEKKGWARQ
jgi:glycosyltransferase involved in cell wall biosynthesis